MGEPRVQFAGWQEWLRDLRDFLSRVTADHSGRRRWRLADTSDEGMIEILVRAVRQPPASRWERGAVRATIGRHAIRMRLAGVTSEQGLARFKDLLHRAGPPASGLADDCARRAREMVRWWVEAYYEPDV